MVRKPKATCQDLFDTLRYPPVYKTYFEIKTELEQQGMRARHLDGVVYLKLERWQKEGFVVSSIRENLDAMQRDGEYYVASYEYARAGPGVPKEFENSAFGELEKVVRV